MHPATHRLIVDTFNASNDGRIHFGEVVARMVQAGVESYVVDYRSHRTTYYLADDETLTLEMTPTPASIGNAFDAEAVRAGIRGAQQGTVMYPEFKRLTMQAGCVGYTVWVAGRHVSYVGRRGEAHVEHFPV